VPGNSQTQCLMPLETTILFTLGIMISFMLISAPGSSKLDNLATGGRRVGEALTYLRLQGGLELSAIGISELDL
jgi:hypothetical protein